MKSIVKAFVFPLLALLLWNAPAMDAQSFTVASGMAEESGDLNGYIPVEIEVTNVSGKDLNLRVEITERSAVPGDWMTQICFFQNCFQPNQDQIDGVFPVDGVEKLDITFMSGTTAGRFCVEVTLTNLDNTSEKEVMTFCAAAGLTSTSGSAPAAGSLAMSQNYPNPFSVSKNANTTVSWYMPSAGNVSLKVYNLLGKEVRTLVSETRSMGRSTISWNGRDNNNRLVAPGVYIYKLNTNTQSLTRRLLITR
ncbi:MAG: T9SS type A sorting domain-containing protein [Bacteroidota bacterium]|nr:T9SS type A sorting domain-containing protein [Bacteroidota bacterium]